MATLDQVLQSICRKEFRTCLSTEMDFSLAFFWQKTEIFFAEISKMTQRFNTS